MPNDAISARLAPLPPKRFLMFALPSAFFPAKAYTSFLVIINKRFTLYKIGLKTRSKTLNRRAPPNINLFSKQFLKSLQDLKINRIYLGASTACLCKEKGRPPSPSRFQRNYLPKALSPPFSPAL